MKKYCITLSLLLGLSLMTTSTAAEWQNPFNINPSIQQYAALPESQQNAICQYYVSWAVGTDKTTPETAELLQKNPDKAKEYATDCVSFISTSTDKELKAFHFFLNNWNHFK